MPAAGHDLVVVGRGPVGMVTALQLASMGVRSTLIDRQAIDQVEHGSKAVLIAGHVVEIALPLGAGQGILDEGIAWTTGRVFVRGKEVEARHVASPAGLVPRVLNLTQQRVEELLLARVRHEPLITVISDATVTGVDLDPDQRAATVSYTVAAEQSAIRARWVIACDGARSTVRRALGIPFTGYGHDDTFLIADIVADLPFPAERHLHFDHAANPRRTILIHPQPGSTWHIDWQVGQGVDAQAELGNGGLDRRLRELTGDIPYEVRWVTAYKFKQLRAEHFRRGCVFLAGDAAHLTSPYGARGMNSGIADAQNIGWRLAMVVRGWSAETLLDGYRTEREFAAEENLSITGRTARFMCPRSPREQLWQRTVLAAARRFPALGRYVDSGRFYEPPAYPAPGNGATRTGPLSAGRLAPDAVLADTVSGIRRLRELLAGYVSVVWFRGANELNPEHVAKTLSSGLPGGFPCRVICVSPDSPGGTPDRTYVHVTDPDSAIARTWNGDAVPATGRLFLIRPDAYIAAIIDPSGLTAESDLGAQVRAAFHVPPDLPGRSRPPACASALEPSRHRPRHQIKTTEPLSPPDQGAIMSDTNHHPPVSDALSGLHRGAVGRLSLLGQSVASIGPSIGAAAFFPFAFAEAGNATWISVLIATVAVLLVGTCIAYIARHRVSPGALYSYIPAGLRSAAAGYLSGIAGLTLGLAATFASLFGFGIYFDAFLQEANIGHLSSGQIAWIDILAFLCAAGLSVLEIRISTRALLAVEIVSMTAITALLIAVLAQHHGGVISHQILAGHGADVHGVILGALFFILGFGGFESAAALSGEARKPRRSVPLVVVASVLIVAVFFFLNAYVQVLGFQGTGSSLADQAFPLASLATAYHVTWLGTIVALGVAVSFFSAMNAFMNYTVRMALQISRDGLLPPALGRIHPRTGAPYVAAGAAVVLVLAGFAVSIATVSQQTMFQDASTFNGYLFSLLYLLVCLAAIGWVLQQKHRLVAVIIAGILGAASMGAEFYYSFVPFPAYPANLPLTVFLCVAGAALLTYCVVRVCSPATAARPLHVHSPAGPDAAAGLAGQPDADPKSSSAAAG